MDNQGKSTVGGGRGGGNSTMGICGAPRMISTKNQSV